MATIAGIQLETNSKGNPIRAIIDLKKRPEAVEFLQQVGAIEKPKYASVEEFFEGTISLKESEKRVITRLREKYGK